MPYPALRPTLAALLILLLTGSQAWADPSNRSGKWQIMLTPMYTSELSMQADSGATADLNARSSFGLGFGYNLNEHIDIGLELGSGSANYSGQLIGDSGTPEPYSANYYISYFNIGGTLNLFRTRFTPFIGGDVGWSYIDSGIPNGNIGELCWWDPWWGYICSPYAQTYTDTKWHYSADVGLRFDLTRSVFLKGSVGQTWIDFKHTGTQAFTNTKLSLGFMF